MSNADIDVVRRVYEARPRGDVERLLELIDPAIRRHPGRARCPGAVASRATAASPPLPLALTGAIDSKVTTDAHVHGRRRGGSRSGRTRGVTKASETEFDIAEVHRWTVRDGKAIAAHFAIDTPAMLRALGGGGAAECRTSTSSRTSDSSSARRETRCSLPRAEGVPFAHACGGHSSCSTCRVVVMEGRNACAERSPKERVIAERLGFPPEFRWRARQGSRVDVTMRRLVLDDDDTELADIRPGFRRRGRGPVRWAFGSHRRARPRPVGDEVHAAVLFADIRGFTSFSAGAAAVRRDPRPATPRPER